MSLRKVADYRIAQRPGAGYVLFKLFNPDNSITDWIGWQYVPPGQLASLHSILMTNNAYYDDVIKIFTTGSPRAELNQPLEIMALNPLGITKPIPKTIKKAKPKTKRS